MTFDEILEQVIALLKRQGRLAYPALKIRFNLDDDYLEAIKSEIIEAQQLATDENGRVLVWAGDTEETPVSISQPEQTNQPDTQDAQPTQVQAPPAETRNQEAERRQLTVMFVDLVGSTNLSGELDPEDYREVVHQYQQVCSDVIQRYAGYIAQYLGDGLLVYFGFPQAHEDDAQRAIHTGLGILNAIENLNASLEQNKGVKLAVRLGIHTGLVVIGEMGGGGRQEQLALGETPNVAARIQGLAEPDTVVMSADTYRLTQGYFACDSLGEHELRGVSQPLVVYRVLRESGVQSRLDIVAARGLTPLVGRESESTLLVERWEQAKADNGQVILLSGEAGIGKSRLVQVLKDHVADEPHTRMECRSSPYFTSSALYPITDFLQRMLRFQPDDTPGKRLEKLTQNLNQYRLPIEETAPLIAALLSLPVPEDRYPPLNLSPQRQRQKTLEAIVAIILELSERQPVLFILEDLHWTDPTTLEFIELLVDQTPTASICILLTCRPEFQPSWSHRSYLTEVTVNRLSRNQIVGMAEQVAGAKGLPDEIAQQLMDKSDGVPLYVEEMTKSVLESGVLKETNGHYELIGSVASLTIPSTLQDSLMSRLDRLVTAKAVAQYASVIGRQFSYELLQAVSELDETILQHDLGRLVEAELVYQRGLPPNATYTFKHALVQDIAYESLLRSTRQGYHRRIAEVLAERFPEITGTQPELLAHHFTKAGLNEQAVEYWQRAGEQARIHSANVEAVAHLSKGLEALANLPETHERMQRELPLQISLALAYHASQGQSAPEVEYAYLRAQELCERVHDDRQLFRVLMGLFRSQPTQREALKYVHELGRVAERTHDPHLLLEARMAQGTIMLSSGEVLEARIHLEQALTLYDPQDHHLYATQSSLDPGVNTLSRLSWTLWLLGYPDQALTRSRETLLLAQELAHVHSHAMVCNFAAILHHFRRESQLVYDQSRVALALATEHKFQQWQTTALILGGWFLTQNCQSEEGITQIQQGLSDYALSGITLYREWYLALLAEAYAFIGHYYAALQTISEAIEITADIERFIWWCELHRIKGRLLLQQSPDNATEAESCFHRSISIAQNQSAKSWELRAATSLAKLWQSQGKRAEARDLLAPVYGWFTEGFDTADLIDAKTLLDELT